MRGYNERTLAEVEELYSTRVITDTGKVRALWKAGWSIKKIAEEFRCTEGRIVQVMQERGII
jgi:hypothetical protein